MLSNILTSLSLRCSSLTSGMIVVRHIRGPREHNRLSKSTERLPETVICPCKMNLKTKV